MSMSMYNTAQYISYRFKDLSKAWQASWCYHREIHLLLWKQGEGGGGGGHEDIINIQPDKNMVLCLHITNIYICAQDHVTVDMYMYTGGSCDRRHAHRRIM